MNLTDGSAASKPVTPPPTQTQHHHHRHPHPDDAEFLREQLGLSNVSPVGPTADVYRIAGYADGLLGTKKPECLPMMALWDSGLKYPDKNNPLPIDLLWGGGVRAGVTWDGTFYRDVSRYPAGFTVLESVPETRQRAGLEEWVLVQLRQRFLSSRQR